MSVKKWLCAALVSILSLSACGAEESVSIDLSSAAYPLGESTALVSVSDTAINTVKAAVFGANNGYRAGGYGIFDEEKLVFNETMLEKIAESGITHIREPGGIEGDYFHWYECVGPYESRTAQVNPFSRGYPSFTENEGEPYDVRFGPDEWFELCRRTGIGLTVQLNTGTGTPQEAVDFIRYCLDSGAEIESIAVGNEACMEEERVSGIKVTMTPEEYTEFYNEMLELMGEDMLAELKERGIPFGCIGLPGSHALSIHRKWDAAVLSGISVTADFIDIHIGYSPFNVNLSGVDAKSIHLALLASSKYVDSLLKAEIKTISSVSPDTKIKMSEYGPLGNAICYGTAGALYLASFFNTVLAQEKVVSADYLPLCYSGTSRNTLIGANVSEDLYWDNVVTYVYRMYAEQTGRRVLETSVEDCAVFKAQAVGLMPRQLNVPEGEAAVYYDPQSGAGTLFVLNKAYETNTAFSISLPFEKVTVNSVTELWNADFSLSNTQQNPTAVVPVDAGIENVETGGLITLTTKPVSLVKIDFSVPQ